MAYEPTWHQNEDSEEMLKYQHAYLWADPGTGKTVTALEAWRRSGYSKLIVVCPPVAVHMWKVEAEYHLKAHSKFRKAFFARVLYNKACLNKKLPLYSADALIVSYRLMMNFMLKGDKRTQSLFMKFMMGGERVGQPGVRPFDERYETAIVFDEAHNLKSPTAKQTIAAFGPNLNGEAVNCAVYGVDSVWQLTGSPITRHFDDLYSQLRIGRYGVLKHYKVETRDKYERTFCYKKVAVFGRSTQRVVCGSKNTKLLKTMLNDCKIIRRKLQDVVGNLPALTKDVHTIELSERVSAAGIDKLEAAKLLKALSNPESMVSKTRRALGIAKTDAAAAYINAIKTKPVLIAFKHINVGRNLIEKLNGNYAYVAGGIQQNERVLIREAFINGTIDGIVGQVNTMGESWNLQNRSGRVIIVETLSSPSEYKQLIGRVYRKGQTEHVYVTELLSPHSLDDALLSIRVDRETDIKGTGV